MAVGDRTYQWAGHTAWGVNSNVLQNVIEHTFGYTYHKKKVSNATAGAVLASTASTTGIQTITTGLTNPDVPRVLAATLGGSGLINGTVTVTGTNVEGKTITDSFAYTGTGQVAGTLVFKTVSKVVFPAQSGVSATLTIDTLNKLGLNHRVPANYGTIVVIQASQVSPYTPNSSTFAKPTAQAAPSSSNVDGEFVEKNWVQPATTPDGTKFLYFFYWFHKVLVYPPKDSPEFYSTTTSTSSTSTSTTTSSTSSSTSISSTSTSISSTSQSTTTSVSTSTSTTTSSTSTSTTTLPV